MPDTAEFAEFYTANFHRIAAQLYAYLGDHAEAQDLTQEAFCRALDRWGKVSAYEDAHAWVRKVAWNLATSRLRHLRVAARHLAQQRPEHIEGPGPDRVALSRALATLPPNHRLAVVLHHLGHLSVNEIAEQQGVAEGTVRSWLSRGRSQLAEYFMEKQSPQWQAETTTAIRAPGIDQAVTGVRRRRAVRRSSIAALVVALVALPAGVAAAITPAEQATVLPSDPLFWAGPDVSITVRYVVLPGTGSGIDANVRPQLLLADSQRGWAFYDLCKVEPRNKDCSYQLGSTNDGGRTWRTANLPDVPPTTALQPIPLDGATLTFQSGANLYLTKDRGTTYREYSAKQPPKEAQLAKGGPYQLVCPGESGFEKPPRTGCAEPDLVQVGEGPVYPEPPLTGPRTSVLTGPDGRIWLWDWTVPDHEPSIMVSADGGKKWESVAIPPKDARTGSLRLSPDGQEVWLEGRARLLRLVGDTWQEQLAVSGLVPRSWAPIGAGGLALTYQEKFAFLLDGVLKIVPEIPGDGRISVLADGAISVATSGGTYLTSNPGDRRSWILLK
ncbi:sigma-70 family RNA polymerase sigma factor [Allorhizocola rhizosphaerae]|uniref:sigma-70 family RNA polymerase sigma factor n=1 Tax=Allorhizocola rhizosphaerae TaxID=1872709 RepID=UPI000E3EA318